MQLTYKLIRSNRKTLALEVKGTQVLVRAPYECPQKKIDEFVVVHELCHRKEMNHSKRFYAEVYRVCPEYNKYHKWLKEHGNALMALVR